MVKVGGHQPGRTARGPGSLSLEGRTVPAGARSRRFAAGLLGLSDPGSPFPVTAVAWADHALEVSVQIGEAEVVFLLERKREGAAGLVTTEHLVLYYRGQDIPVQLRERVMEESPTRLTGLTIESVAEEIARDPELGDPGLAMPAGLDDSERPASLLDTWGDDQAYADFFAGGELARAQLDSLDPGKLFSFIQHSDCECLHVNPHCGGPIVWLVNYPWDNRIRHGLNTIEQQDLTAAAVDGMITTDLDENDVIMGNPEKLQRALAQAERVHRRSGKTLFFSNTCTPVVTGEDVESEVKHFQQASGCPLLYLTVTPRSMVNVFHEVLVDHRLAAEEQAGPAPDRSVNLIGFRSDPETDELRSLLGRIGVEVNTVLLPDLSFELIERLPNAALNVYAPNQLWQHLYDQLQFSSRIPAVSPAAPFGVEATVGWLSTIGSVFGLTSAHQEFLHAAREEGREALRAARPEGALGDVGFVVRADETHFLTTPAETWGVPLLAMCEEMGFGIDVFIQVDGRETARSAARTVQACFAHPERHVIKAFDRMELMLRRIEESRATAFFSSSFFDWRATSRGKSTFSLQHFEMGFEGARHTANRIQGVCQTPFYRRYARHLGRTAAGLRRKTGDRGQSDEG